MTRCLIAPLIALLVLTSVAFGAARGQAPATDRVELCAGLIVKHILLDAEGNEVSGHVLCADAALALLAAVDAAPISDRSVPSEYALFTPRFSDARDAVPPLDVPQARGPPFLI
ncbi:MAG: hypothetical protein ACU0DW_03560 [Shimia sp.]